MTRLTRMMLLLLMIALVFACTSCESGGTSDGDKGVTTEPEAMKSALYTKYNIHYYFNKGKYYASYANYVEPLEHGFLPYNSQIEIGRYRRGFQIISSGKTIHFELHERNMGMGRDEYIKLITSSEPVSYDTLSDLDKEMIAQGQVKEGMTKQGVMASWGYPAKHRTPSTNENTWIFWKDRFRTAAVNFGDDGKVSSIVR